MKNAFDNKSKPFWNIEKLLEILEIAQVKRIFELYLLESHFTK